MSIPRTRPPKDAVEFEAEVPFHDVDALRVVWHGHYYKYFEVARTLLFARHAIDGPDLMELGYRFVVSNAESRHVSALTYRDRYRVRAWFLGDAAHRVDVAYEVWSVTNDVGVARGRTEVVTTDAQGTMQMVVGVFDASQVDSFDADDPQGGMDEMADSVWGDLQTSGPFQNGGDGGGNGHLYVGAESPFGSSGVASWYFLGSVLTLEGRGPDIILRHPFGLGDYGPFPRPGGPLKLVLAHHATESSGGFSSCGWKTGAAAHE